MLDRYLGVVTGVVFLFLLVPLMIRDWVVLQREALHDIQWHTSTVTQLLSEHLKQFNPLPAALEDLHDPQLYREFDARIRDQIGLAGLEKVHICNHSGEPAAYLLLLQEDPRHGRFRPGEPLAACGDLLLPAGRGALQSRHL